MSLLRSLVLLCAFIPLAVPPALATSPSNPWMDRQPLNFAHQGGAHEAPSNTLYAFKRADSLGADVLELDVHATADGHLVVIHDATVDRTTNGTGRVDSKTLSQIKSLDAAYWFSGGADTCKQPTCVWPYRGMATGQVAPLTGYSSNDFTIPTLEEVLATFPHKLINVEIKASAPNTVPYEKELSDLMKAFGRTDDTIVVSFLDNATELFKLHNSEVSTALGTGGAAAFWASSQAAAPGAPNPRYQALQVPIVFNGITVVTPQFVEKAHANGLAVHVWTINTKTEMCWLLSIGVDGIMTDVPSLLQSVLIGDSPC